MEDLLNLSSELSESNVVAVMGPTGGGKSYFIQKATGSARVVVGHGLQPGQ